MTLTHSYRLVLQATHSSDAVRSAAIALGSMGQRLHINNVLNLENQQANACHDFAHVQYHKALTQLREQLNNDPDQSVDLAIILSFVFTIFEFLRGNDAGSMLHLRSGLKILRRENKSSPEPDLLRQEIMRVFSVMDLQATIWLGLESFQSPVIMPLDTPPAGVEKNDGFSSLEEAATSLNVQIIRIYHFRRLVSADGGLPSLDQLPPTTIAQRENLIANLQRWPFAVEALLTRLGAELSADMLHRVTVMRMNHITILIMILACLQRDEELIYHERESDFAWIISAAKSLVLPMNDTVRMWIERIVAANNIGINPIPGMYISELFFLTQHPT